MAAAWLWEGNYKVKTNRFLHNRSAILISGLFILHLLGMLYSSDIPYGLNDIRVKIPLLCLPFMMASFEPLEPKQVKHLLLFLVLSVLTSTLISTGVLLGIVHHEYHDIREISLFISHIRLSLLICFCIYTCAYYAFHSPEKLYKFISAIIILWFIFFLLILKSATGIVILTVSGWLFALWKVCSHPARTIRLGGTLLVIVIPLLLMVLIKQEEKRITTIHREYSLKYPIRTERGNLYENYPEKNNDYENGYPIWISLCLPEAKEAWNKKSNIDFNGFDKKGQQIRYTLIRFLTSKGKRKDYTAVMELSPEEVHLIESGTTNVNYSGVFNFKGRMDQILWDINNFQIGGNPNGHTLAQRFEFWKVGKAIFLQHPYTGVGTGDVQKAFDEEYEKRNSLLEKSKRLHAHNQFFTFAIAFGIFGFLYFVAVLIFPFLEYKKLPFLYIVFFMIAFLSMFWEDTLETQAGVTFYTFLNCFLLFNLGSKKELSK